MKLNSKKLEAERKRLGETRMVFAKRIGMSPSAYGRMIEGATTKIATITRIAASLYLDPKDLLTN